MALEVLREFKGQFQTVGRFNEIDANNAKWTFQYSSDYLADESVRPLSLSLPLQAAPFERAQYQGFFEGMAPEGRARTELAHRFRVSPSDFLGLLEHIGDECVGAIRFRSDAEGEHAPEPQLSPLDADQLQTLVSRPVAAVSETLIKTRLSLAGAQSKIGIFIESSDEAALCIEPRGWFLPTGTAPSTHILKIADNDHQGLAENELVCMELARACGIEVAESAIVEGFEQFFVSRRFDRYYPDDIDMQQIGDRKVPWQLHQEDFCQALGWPSYLKYEIDNTSCYAMAIGNLITKMSADVIGDKRKFARITLFNYFVGNCDNHMKNHSFLYSPTWDAARLAPLYDVMCTTILGYDRKMGICIGDHQVIDEMTFDDWRLFGEDLRLGRNVIKRLYDEMLERVTESFSCVEAKLPDRAAEQFDVIRADMQPRLKPWAKAG